MIGRIHLRQQRVGNGALGGSDDALQALVEQCLEAKTGRNTQHGRQRHATPAQRRTCRSADSQHQCAGDDSQGHASPVGRNRLAATVQALVQGFGPLHLAGCGAHPYRLVALNLTVLINRCDKRIDPVVIAVVAAVFDDAHPGAPALEVGPHVSEDRSRCVGVAHHVVRAADQLFPGEATDVHKSVIAVSDDAFEVGGGDQPLGLGEGAFSLRDGLVVAHVRILC